MFWADTTFHSSPQKLCFVSMMIHVYYLKTVSTSDGRCMEVCLSIWIKKCNKGGKKTYFAGLLCRFVKDTKSSRFTYFNVSRNVRATLVLYMSIQWLGQLATFYYDISDMWLKWYFIGDIIYHNMWYKIKTRFPTISIVNLGFLCFPNIK